MVMSIRTFPASGIVGFERELDSLFDTFFASPRARGWYPRLNVVEYENRSEVYGELPGVPKDKLSVTIEDDTLLVKGVRSPQEFPDGAQWISREIPTGEFIRSLRLPHAVKLDAVTADLSDGVLHIVLPKADEAMPKQVEIR